jgi:hypothetical protein
VKPVSSTGTLSGFLDGVVSSETLTGERFAPWESTSGTFGIYYAVGASDSINLGDGTYFNGNVAEFRVWNTGRTNTEILNNRNRRLAGNESGLAAYYRLDDVSGTTAPDTSIHNRDATLYGNAQSGFAGGPDRVLAPVHLGVSDADFDPSYLTVSSDSPYVTAVLDGTTLVITPESWYQGTARITVTATDGVNAPHDSHGRSDVMSFDFTTGASAVYGTVWNDQDGDGVRDPAAKFPPRLAEPALDGNRVFIDLDGNRVLSEGDVVTYADANGNYAFPELPFLAPVPYLPAEVVADQATTTDGGAVQTVTNEEYSRQTITETFARLSFTVRDSIGGTYAFDIELPGHLFSDSRRTVTDLVNDLNALLLAATDGVAVVQASVDLGNHLVFGVSDVNRAHFPEQIGLAARTETRVTERVLVDGTWVSRVVASSTSNGAMGFGATQTDEGTSLIPDASLLAKNPITATGGLTYTVASDTTTGEKTTRTSIAFGLSLDGGPITTLTVTPELTGDNPDLAALAADLEGLLGDDLGSAVRFSTEDGRLVLTTTGLGATRSLEVTVDTSSDVTRRVIFSDGYRRDVYGGVTTSGGGLGFGDSQSGQGSDWSYEVIETPFPGWAPTIGSTTVDGLPVGVIPVLMPLPGAIAVGVDFGNVRVLGADLGSHRTVGEGTTVTASLRSTALSGMQRATTDRPFPTAMARSSALCPLTMASTILPSP